MKHMQRQFGKLKGPGDAAKVSVLLNDYEDADKVLTKIIEASKAWRDAWVSILSIQLATISGFEELYNPIIGTTDGHGHKPALASQQQLDRTAKLKQAYTELKTDLTEEVIMMDARVIKPATEAKECLQPIRKTIKKRENKRLDWERYLDKVNSQSKKMTRTDRENAALAKTEQDLARAADEFKVADDHLRETLPPIINAAFSILPHLLGVQILIQNTLLAQYYTVLHNYCEDTGFPSPPPPMEDVIKTWNKDLKPVQQEIEAIRVIARGKAVHESMALGDDPSNRKASTGLSVRNGFNRRPSTQGPTPSGNQNEPRVMRIPSNSIIPQSARDPSPSPEPQSHSNHPTPTSSYSSHTPAGLSGDNFQRGVAGKKKPPPPPPKRIPSSNCLYAVALYSFEGQSQGDLSFKEGDQIQVVKKTDSTDDWWEGKLHGVQGSFPANYCKIG